MKIKISDFTFINKGYGIYHVSYISPVRKIKHTNVTTNMKLIDATKNAESVPKQEDLVALRTLCKAGYSVNDKRSMKFKK